MEDDRLKKLKLLVAQERYQQAEKIARTLLTENPNDIICLYWLSEIFYQQGKNVDAADVVNTAISLS